MKINNEKEYEEALNRMYELINIDPEKGTPEDRELDELLDDIDEYESM